MAKSYIFSSESVTEGHPDKVADTISDAVLDACLAQDKHSRVACETLVKSNLVVVAGEITTKADFDYNKVVRNAIEEIGYTEPGESFNAKGVHIMNALTAQSPDIAQGVDEKAAEGKGHRRAGRGRPGPHVRFRLHRDADHLMPAPIYYAHALGERLTKLRKGKKVSWLRPDCKTQVSLQYNGTKIERIDAVVVSTQHRDTVKHKEIEAFHHRERDQGRAAEGTARRQDALSRQSDGPLRHRRAGRRFGPHRAARSSSIPTAAWAVTAAARFRARTRARSTAARPTWAGTWRRTSSRRASPTACEIQFAYAIGHPEPVSVHIDTFGTGKVDDDKIADAVKQVFSFKPANIIKQLNLLRPIYSKTTNYGHFGRTDDLDALTWEKTDKAADLKKAAGV